MTAAEQKELRLFAVKVREGILRGTHAAKSGHPGGSLSSADYFTYLYKKEIRVDPKNPHDPNRDRFVLSKGHVAPGLYATLANCGFFPVEELLTLRHIGSRLQGHPNMNYVPGVDMSTGSLGQGLAAADGMALANKLSAGKHRVYCLLGDGECEEGEVWEAAMAAAHYKSDNLCAIVDMNGLQIDGWTKDVIGPEPIADKFRAFGWHVLSCNGHDFTELRAAFAEAARTKGSPSAIIAHTVKGKGVSFMENQAGWHGKAPNQEQYQQAMAELEEQ